MWRLPAAHRAASARLTPLTRFARSLCLAKGEASDAWHLLRPERKLGDLAALRESFDKLDLDNSGKIDLDEAMIASADLNSDGQIDFEEYKKIVGYSENRRATPDYANQTRIYSSMDEAWRQTRS
ncbi:hypothetical protein EMIHUDRAFT_194755 [Emiliania huxleyi CCMP1516]|uniref:EF-hand domain-containing protein n=2 Tax=Emiliania huxleyi TaxID=2903 RepID=A0A0D3IZ94_EMIH1|nr:hypothetical protein EMIHUDRAFT_244957 [Emiliania huxleyi CCMP1516]XP_005794491.1 hypothetical protein EMIHUDRAFT_194755 [Emiliania huxleyi CCMP1516]EOD16579.1 hypothetical protein EMIHUDRAFT_244957 [Emiliania huxleyi CCMP1516]EOD42062.1 hypothetical protein EMIHUDRAFT_194755 [Emiliania huxleyi CCMP1516]|eukprot:XP_005769008.1 hypothetical protein EMIHUDRAFT_244957 [Emiliania huxleyi CCMP1516]